ncbi:MULTISPECIES: hypothetical protein [unclassified Moorena]|uniref:hypothetical protein n=1 Tax=unclassified Moorena TaxID=2683338 RepID=UPI0025E4B846|nr:MULTISPECIES: hypothetical protein [unclassified Moorena]
MIAKLYTSHLEKQLSRAHYLVLMLVIGILQKVKNVKLEVLAQALPIPILFESRIKKLQRFLDLEQLTIEKCWLPCVELLLKQVFCEEKTLYLAIDRTSWGLVNILMVSLILQKRALPIAWILLDKKGNSNLENKKSSTKYSPYLLSIKWSY